MIIKPPWAFCVAGKDDKLDNNMLFSSNNSPVLDLEVIYLN
jgi:hypothetical protein